MVVVNQAVVQFCQIRLVFTMSAEITPRSSMESEVEIVDVGTPQQMEFLEGCYGANFVIGQS